MTITVTTHADSQDPLDDYDPGVPANAPREGAAPEEGPLDPMASVYQADRWGYSDVTNAERFIEDHGDNLRFIASWDRWLMWNETRWVEDELNASLSLAIATARKTVADAENLVAESEDGKAAGRALAAAKTLLQVTRMRNMITAATAMGVSLTPHGLNSHHMLLNVSNGTIDLTTGLLHPHRREDLITNLADITFDPDAVCPTWDRFLDFVTCGDKELALYLQLAVGYSLSAVIREHVLFFLHGGGNNGKSTFLTVLLNLLGDAGIQAEENLLMARQSEAHPTGQADLFGRRVAVTTEVDEGRRLSEGLVKQLTGGDRVRARRMRENFFEFDPTHKLWMSGNHLPIIRGNDLGVWRRVKLIPFNAKLAPGEADTELGGKLAAEMSGILAWAVRGCLSWQASGLGTCAAVEAGTKGYKSSMDALGLFIEECVTDALDAFTPSIDMYRAYQAWAKASGEFVMSRRALGNRLKDRGWESAKRGANGNLAWLGRSLHPDALPFDGRPF